MRITLLLSLVLAWPAFAGAENPVVGYIVGLAATGAAPKAELKREGASSAAEKEQGLHQDEHLVTGAATSVSIELNDGSAIIVGPNSDFVAGSVETTTEKATRLKLASGVAHFMVSQIYGTDKTFVLATVNGAITVHGTEFVVEHGKDGSSSCHSLDGTVVMAASEGKLSDATKSAILKTGKWSELKKNASQPGPALPYEVSSYLDKLDGRIPSMQTLRAQSASKFALSNSPAAGPKSEQTPAPKSQGRRGGRRRGVGF